MRVLAIIPARGGSKGLPGKNVKLLGGKPLIAHAIECALGSKKVSETIVSTDDDAIAGISRSYGIRIIDRPEDMAQDESNVVTAVEHAYKTLNGNFDVIVLLQPTSPLRTSADLDNVIALLEKNPDADGVISVVAMDDVHPARMYNLENGNRLVPFLESGETARRQDIAPVYYRNGCFYAVRADAFFRERSFMVRKKLAYVMDVEWLANIDNYRDFKLTAVLYDEWNENIGH